MFLRVHFARKPLLLIVRLQCAPVRIPVKSMHHSSSPHASSIAAPDAVAGGDAVDQNHFIDHVRESLQVKCHLQLMLWLQGDFQRSLPHQIFIAAWGDFSRGLVQHDVVSRIPALRTSHIANRDISQLTSHLFHRWLGHGAQPFAANFENLTLGPDGAEREGMEAFSTMRSVMVHGVRDARGRHDCIYIFMNSDPCVAPKALDHLRIMLPFVDMVVRQVEHLPCQSMEDVPPREMEIADEPECMAPDLQLSIREMEIMDWVRMGKTNYEVGKILNISTFTVKNHLQRIFRKLDVTNRAQAVSEVRRISTAIEEAPAILAHCEACPRAAACSR